MSDRGFNPCDFNWNALSNGVPYITFTKLGIAFNRASILALGSPDKVIIGFDERNLTIGVMAYQQQAGVRPHPFACRENNGWVRVGCRDFVRRLSALTGADFTKAKRYVALYDKEEKCLIAALEGKGHE